MDGLSSPTTVDVDAMRSAVLKTVEDVIDDLAGVLQNPYSGEDPAPKVDDAEAAIAAALVPVWEVLEKCSP